MRRVTWFERTGMTVLFLCLVLAGASATGPREAEQPKGSTEEQVEIVFYLPGDPQPDQDLVVGEVNKLLLDRINATVKFRHVSWSDFGTKFPLLTASGEEFDLIYTSGWAYFNEQTSRGGFIALEDLLPTYMPNMWELQVPETWLKYTRDGSIYAVPNFAYRYATSGVIVRGDLMVKYGMKEIASSDDFMTYLAKVKENEPDLMPYNAGGAGVEALPYDWAMTEQNWIQVVTESSCPILLREGDREPFSLLENEVFISYLRKMREGYLNGYWSRSVLSNQVSSYDAFLAGNSAATLHNFGTMADLTYSLTNRSHPDWDVRWYRMASPATPVAVVGGNDATGVNVNAANPTRALMFLDLAMTDPDLYRLLNYGIRGVHWDIGPNGGLTIPPGINTEQHPYPEAGLPTWGMVNDNLRIPADTVWPLRAEFESSFDQSAYYNTMFDGFVFDIENVKIEMAAATQIYSRYIVPLMWGVVDVDEGLAEAKAQLERAGVAKIYDELHKQLGEYFASNAK